MAAAAEASANNDLNAAEEARTKSAEAKQELSVQLEARRNQDDKTEVAKKAAKLAATIAVTTTHAAKAKTEEALLLASKKQQEADLAKQRATDTANAAADKEAALKNAESEMNQSAQEVKAAQDKLAQDEETQRDSSKEYFEAATEAGAQAKKSQDAAKAVADATDNIKTMEFASGSPQPPTLVSRIKSILRSTVALLDVRSDTDVQELSR